MAEAGQAGAGVQAPVPAAELIGITKRFGAVVACDAVDLALAPGEIHGLLGQNGAGKSTLMKVLIGLVLPDAGTIRIRGETVALHSPQDAAAHGIGMVHQHFSLVDALTVWENVLLGEAARLDRTRARDQVTEIGARYGLAVDPDATVGSLTAGQRQRVEIVKCLRRDPRILIFDEPTSVLTPAESEQLFDVLRTVVRDEGRAVALVSHKLDEVLHATDRITIMRDGRVVNSMRTVEADARGLARAMVGREVSLRSESVAVGAIEAAARSGVGPISHAGDPVVLRVAGATVRARDGSVRLDGLDLEVRRGEILGVAGVEGNGQRSLGDVLASLVRLDAGTVEIAGRPVRTGQAGAMAKAGVGAIPEDRHDSGCVLDMTVAENLVLSAPQVVARGGVLDRVAMHARAEALIAEFDIQCEGPDAPMWSLSGGNQQRVVLARELSMEPVTLVAAQPTRGLDVGAIEYMTGRLKQAAGDGVGVLLISTELEEILALSHRIVVLFRGRVVGAMDRTEVDLERLGLLLGGVAA